MRFIGLGVAFAPLLAFMSGAVNPDALLCAFSAALFYCLARGFRRGLTPRLALTTGLVISAGLLTKLNFIGLLPGAALGLLLLIVRARRVSTRAAHQSLALSSAATLTHVCAYVLLNALTGRSAYGTFSSGIASTADGSALHEVSYIWQFYLPRLPGMHDYFPGLSTTHKFWIDGLIGLYGWVDTVFPSWVYNIALVPLALLATLLTGTLLARLHCLRCRADRVRNNDSRFDDPDRRQRLPRLPHCHRQLRTTALPSPRNHSLRRRARARRTQGRTQMGANRRHLKRRAPHCPRHLQPATRDLRYYG
jgi:Predicted membrane protein (DUF2142)